MDYLSPFFFNALFLINELWTLNIFSSVSLILCHCIFHCMSRFWNYAYMALTTLLFRSSFIHSHVPSNFVFDFNYFMILLQFESLWPCTPSSQYFIFLFSVKLFEFTMMVGEGNILVLLLCMLLHFFQCCSIKIMYAVLHLCIIKRP